MSVLRVAGFVTIFMMAAVAAWGQAPCNCGLDPMDNYPAEGVPSLIIVDKPPSPGVLVERTPCTYKPHDLDPCYNFRCFLYPGSPPSWLYVGADYAPLFRDSPRDVTFQTLDQQGAAVLGTQTLDMEFQGGVRFTLGGVLSDIYRVETSYLGLQHWDETDTVRDFSANDFARPGNLFSPFTNFGDPLLNVDFGPNGVTGLDFNNLAAIRLRTSYDSVETNFLVDMPRIRNLESAASFGVRYTKIDEDFGYNSASEEPFGAGGSTVAIQNAVNNELIGLQLGYRARFLAEERFWIDFDIKGAIYQNNLDHRFQYQRNQGAATVGFFADAVEDHKTTFGGDLSLVGHYLVTPTIALRLGYQGLLLDGLALAAENIVPDDVRVQNVSNVNNVQFNPLEIDHTGRVIYHGPVAGIMGMW